jgi:hypothetical protein
MKTHALPLLLLMPLVVSAALMPPILNPERGFRMETEQITSNASLAIGLRACIEYNMSVTLGYAYITEYWNTSVLPEAYLRSLESSFQQMREVGVKTILNIAYMDGKKNFTADPEPLSLDIIYGHINQLASIVQRNADVVYALQAGFIGNAGEWAHDNRNFVHNHSGLAMMVARELYTLLPKDRSVLIRRPYQKRNWLLSNPLPKSDPNAALWHFSVADAASVGSKQAHSRMGFYNAGFLSNREDGGTWSSHTLVGDVPDDRDPYFQYMTQESPFVPIDGEAYWGTPNPMKNRSLVEGHAAALRFFQHHYNTFSHHNSFWPLDPENTTGPGSSTKNKSLNQWMVTPLNLTFIDEHKLPISNAYRTAVASASAAGDGATIYEYIRDHLGYRLEFSTAPTVALAPNRTLSVIASVSNYGFSAFANPRSVLITLQAKAGVNPNANPRSIPVLWSTLAGDAHAPVDPRAWQPHVPLDPLRQTLNHSLNTDVQLPAAAALPAGTYLVGVALPDPRKGYTCLGCSVRFANLAERTSGQTPFWFGGINVIGSVQLQ